ncbi:hypothetical protein ACGF13_28465 [Kitasatospora sp. NPDC048286]|uniref:hypothetical protein n=1 Tax=Kitasatospora sp. NPDC048286 TaxID=3364047 RepID=UPI00372391BD
MDWIDVQGVYAGSHSGHHVGMLLDGHRLLSLTIPGTVPIQANWSQVIAMREIAVTAMGISEDILLRFDLRAAICVIP